MFCPKCGGGTFIADEELVKILEGSRPLKAIVKIHYVCRACNDRFGRIIHENLEEKRRDVSGVSVQVAASPTQSSSSTVPETLRFF